MSTLGATTIVIQFDLNRNMNVSSHTTHSHFLGDELAELDGQGGEILSRQVLRAGPLLVAEAQFKHRDCPLDTVSVNGLPDRRPARKITCIKKPHLVVPDYRAFQTRHSSVVRISRLP
jgi:hypothetical protein